MYTELPTLHITEADLNDRNEYIGATDVSDYAWNIEIAADLGWVKFSASPVARGHILSLAGSSIKAGWAISAKFVSARLRIFAGLCSWRLPKDDECEIRADVHSGIVAFGTVVSPENIDSASQTAEG